jgi:multiple sugar transport system substrate-binding protein
MDVLKGSRGPLPQARRRLAGSALALATTAGLLTACGGGGGVPTLTWYINPDNGGQAAVAAACTKAANGAYKISTQTLPQDAGQQRVQLARRLAAHDPGIDLMSIDPAYTAEIANAGFLAPISAKEQGVIKSQSFPGATTNSTWANQISTYPFWSNVQVLWYRKSFVQKIGLDMTKPVTWDQIIKAAADNGGTVGVQANKYEGYVVWINALISGAGGSIIQDPAAGDNAKVTINSPDGVDAANIINELAHSKAASPDLTIAQEGQAGSTFGAANGAFLVNWTYIFHNYDTTQPDVAKDIGYAMYPETVAGKPSAPPYGGIAIGVSKYSKHVDLASQAAACIIQPQNQGVNAVLTGNMPASKAGYQYAPLQKLYPQSLRKLFIASLNHAAPRSVSPYWSDISGAIQDTWHPPTSVNSQTPAASATFIEDILKGKKLL